MGLPAEAVADRRPLRPTAGSPALPPLIARRPMGNITRLAGLAGKAAKHTGRTSKRRKRKGKR